MGSRVVNPLDAPVIGLLAGWGRYPVVLAEVLRQQQRRLIGMGVKDHADPELRPLCDQYVELGLGRLGAALRYFRRHGVTTATMAGKIHKVLLFSATTGGNTGPIGSASARFSRTSSRTDSTARTTRCSGHLSRHLPRKEL